MKTSNEMSNRMSDTVDKGQEVLSKVMDNITPVYEKAEEAVSDSLSFVKTTVKKNPLQALAIGFGVGCLVGLLWRNR